MYRGLLNRSQFRRLGNIGIDPRHIKYLWTANVFKMHVLIARRLLEICWTFAGRLLDVCCYHTSHGNVSVVRTTSKVYGKMQNLTLSQPKTPEPSVAKFEWRDYVVDAYHQTNLGSIRSGVFAPHIGLGEIYTPFVRNPLQFFGSWTRLQASPLDRFLRLKVHGHGQTHSRNFCRFKLDI